MKIGIIREGKTPPDKRVPLTPDQCALIMKKYPQVSFYIQKSEIRCFKDAMYNQAGAKVVDDLSDCDLIMGVKEVPQHMLIRGKTYMFFSHTAKKQAYNKSLLLEILKRKNTLIDYEYLTNEKGFRLIGFGRYAGVVGAYNAFLTFGDRFGQFKLKPAYLCDDRKEMEAQLGKISLPNIKIVLTGSGRVSKGAKEILDLLNIKEVSAAKIKSQNFTQPVYCNLEIKDWFQLKAGGKFQTNDYYEKPQLFKSTLNEYTGVADILITGHSWSPEYPKLLSKQQLKHPDQKTKVIADISCDIDDPIASTLRPSVIGDPYFYYDPYLGVEVDAPNKNAIAVMSVDNLPCELPKDASQDFGAEFIEYILPEFFKGNSEVLDRATIVKSGELNKPFQYLQTFASE